MSPASISGVEKHFPEAPLTFAKFDVIEILNDAASGQARGDQGASRA